MNYDLQELFIELGWAVYKMTSLWKVLNLFFITVMVFPKVLGMFLDQSSLPST